MLQEASKNSDLIQFSQQLITIKVKDRIFKGFFKRFMDYLIFDRKKDFPIIILSKFLTKT